MGVVYKLKPEVKNFILEKKKSNPALSCRALVLLAENKFNTKISKSTINFVIKESGLSMPVGRRSKRRTKRFESGGFGLGAILLKAADYLVGGANYIAQAIKKRLKIDTADILAKTEYLLYGPLFGEDTLSSLDCGLWNLIEQKFTSEAISSFINRLQQDSDLRAELSKIILAVFQEVRGIKVILSDGSSFYLDGQLHTVWSQPRIPYQFSTTDYNIKAQINRCFKEDSPCVLFMAPGYNIPTKEFFDFLLGLDFTEKKVVKIIFYNNRLNEIETMDLDRYKRHFFIFGLWPWQFKEYRRIKITREFKPFSFEVLREDLYLAEVETELSQPNINKTFALRGCALRTNLNGKTRVMILSNISPEKATPEKLANIYLEHWSNPEEAFRDYSRKIELFTYTAKSQHFFSIEKLNIDKDAISDINKLFSYYLKGLDMYVRWHFLPTGYEDKDLSTIKEQFYNLKANLIKQKDQILVSFQPPADYPYTKELDYLCCRINEREIVSYDGRRLWLRVG